MGTRKINKSAKILFLALLINILLITSAMHSAQNSILLVYSGEKVFDEVITGLTEELEDELIVKKYIISDKTTAEDLSTKIKSILPKMAVLLDNASIYLFKEYQKNLPANSKYIPSISLMAVGIDNAIKGIKNAKGIAYEIPIVTSSIYLRSILRSPIKKIGIIHRQFLQDFIDKNRIFCRKEQIEIINILLSKRKSNLLEYIEKSLRQLITKENVDAIWLPNDNKLLRPKIVKKIWIPFVDKYKKPVIVGIELFVSKKIGFGTFAVLPDHISLGAQAAEFVFEAQENNWEFSGKIVHEPISAIKILNYKQAKKYFNISDEGIKNIDKLYK